MSTRPNVVILMTDHTRSVTTRPGSPCRVPAIDRLARRGVRFHRAYTTNSICSPSRASLFTGQYASTHGVWDCTHTQRREWVDVRQPTFWSQRLAEAGYVNGYFGKWHVEQSNDPARYGFTEHDVNAGSAGKKIIEGTRLAVQTAGYKDALLAALADDSQGEWSHPAFDRGIDFIRRHAKGAQPFCVVISASEPHDPYVAPRGFFERYDAGSIPLSATLRQEAAGLPEVIRRMRSVWASLTDENWRYVTACYYATISWLDSQIARVTAAVDQAGVAGETILLCIADHGDMVGGHGLFAKGITPYEEVYNIPFVLCVPGLRSGEDTRHVVSTVDVAPTLLDLCGAAPLEQCQGRSLRAVLDGSANGDDWQDAHAEFYGQRFVYTQRITWHGRWKYVFSPCGTDELFDLEADPGESRNLAGDPAHRQTLLDLCGRMWAKIKAVGDESLYNTHYATLRLAPAGPLPEA